MMKQEETRKEEFNAKGEEFKAMRAHSETVRLRDIAQPSRCYSIHHISSLNSCHCVSLIVFFSC